MRDIMVPVALILAAIGGLAWWSLKSGSIYPSSPPPATIPQPAESKPSPTPPTKRKPKPPAAPIPEPSAEVKSIPAPDVSVLPEPVPVRPIPPFPAVEEIQSGAQEENIVERYGEPALSTTVSDHEHVFEMLIYTRERGQFQTLIRVEDGRVLAAYAQRMPPPPNALVTNTPVRH